MISREWRPVCPAQHVNCTIGSMFKWKMNQNKTSGIQENTIWRHNLKNAIHFVSASMFLPEREMHGWLLSSAATDYSYNYILKDMSRLLNTLRPRQNGRHFADDIFKCIFLNENERI